MHTYKYAVNKVVKASALVLLHLRLKTHMVSGLNVSNRQIQSLQQKEKNINKSN